VASLRSLDPALRPLASAFVRVLQQAGVQVTITSTRRSLDEQKRLYQNYRAGRSKYPAARPGTSTHGLGYAFDLHLDPPVYEQAGAIWEGLGLTWGGRFKDKIHFDARPRS
jgi:hypothetical protein